MGSPIETFGRYKRTLPHHKRRQLVWRLRFLWRTHVVGRKARMPRHAPEWNAECMDRIAEFSRQYTNSVGISARFLRVLEDQELLLLNYPVGIGEGIPWHTNVASELWRYHLHYMEWCRWVALNPEGGAEAKEQVRGWLLDWQSKNPVCGDTAWDPFVVTQRLISWSQIQSVQRYDDEILARSFLQQVQYLSKNLEQDILGNHLLKNLIALVVAGSLVDMNIRDKALPLLESELAEQILGDGGHFERSPMYHLQLLEELLLARAVLEESPAFLEKTLKKMTAFAAQVRHPDGDIALFNDAARDTARPADKLVNFSRRLLKLPLKEHSKESIALADSGFYIMTPGTEKSRMIVRAGEHGPSYQLGHAHSDLLSYELSMDGKRLVVDSGVQGYGDDPFRGYCRSTRAHNTVCVNGMEQLEAWGVFRVGNRSKAAVLDFKPASYGHYFYGEHRAFAPYIHRRRIHCDRLGLWFVIDEIEGPGKIKAESFIHLHPLWTLASRRGYYSIRITDTQYRIFPFGGAVGSLCRGQKEPEQQGWYCPEFGKSQQSWCLTLSAEGESRIRFGYAIVPVAGNIHNKHELAMYMGALDKEHGFEPVSISAASDEE